MARDVQKSRAGRQAVWPQSMIGNQRVQPPGLIISSLTCNVVATLGQTCRRAEAENVSSLALHHTDNIVAEKHVRGKVLLS